MGIKILDIIVDYINVLACEAEVLNDKDNHLVELEKMD
jgi:hypothetical protein